MYNTDEVLDEVPLKRAGATQPHFWKNIEFFATHKAYWRAVVVVLF
jgi:hypothetical protein